MSTQYAQFPHRAIGAGNFFVGKLHARPAAIPWEPVGNLWEKPGVGPGKEGVPPEEGSEPGALRGYAAVCHGHGTGAASFTDQDEFSDNYAEAAEVLTGMGIIQGYDDGSFLPQRNINRAQVATMIYRAATGDVTDSKISQFVGEDLFDDVNADDWFAGYVNYCGNAELIKGFTPTTFGPTRTSPAIRSWP